MTQPTKSASERLGEAVVTVARTIAIEEPNAPTLDHLMFGMAAVSDDDPTMPFGALVIRYPDAAVRKHLLAAAMAIIDQALSMIPGTKDVRAAPGLTLPEDIK